MPKRLCQEALCKGACAYVQGAWCKSPCAYKVLGAKALVRRKALVFTRCMLQKHLCADACCKSACAYKVLVAKALVFLKSCCVYKVLVAKALVLTRCLLQKRFCL
jgi:hypothetical protein